MIWIALLAGTALTVSGCGGVRASHGVSPASFLLPGLIHHQPSKKNTESEPRPEWVSVDPSKNSHSDQI